MIAHDLTEKDWARQIADLAKMLGWLRYHTHRADRSPAGFPDEVLVRDRVIFMELKRDLTGRKSDDRARVARRHENGGLSWWDPPIILVGGEAA